MEARLVTVEQRQRAVGSGEGIEGNSEAVILGQLAVIPAEALLLFLHTVFKQPGFHACVAR